VRKNSEAETLLLLTLCEDGTYESQGGVSCGHGKRTILRLVGLWSHDDNYNTDDMQINDNASLLPTDPRWYGEQDANGVDLSLIRENLKLTPRERLLRGDRARRNALQLLEYGRRQREETA
jgi:hypothetical protein